MSELDEIKKRRLEELRQNNVVENQESDQDPAKIQEQFDYLEQIVKQKFDKDALLRYGNLKSAHPKKAIQLIGVLAQLINSGHLVAGITEEQLKMLLSKMSPEKTFTIKRR